MNENMSFAEFLKTKRKEKNLSMNYLGKLSNVSPMYISELESGKRIKPSCEVLKKLSKSLEVPYEKLMISAGYIENEKYDSLTMLAEIENHVCSKGKTVFIGGEIKGVFFEFEDFQQLLTLFTEVRNDDDDEWF